MQCRINPGDEFTCGGINYVCLARQKLYLVAFDSVEKKIRRISIHDDLQRSGLRKDALLAGIWKARKAVRVGSFVTVRGLRMKVVKVSPNGGGIGLQIWCG